MKLILSHLTGNANVKAAVYGFMQAGLLGEFHVSLATYSHNILGRLSTIPGFSELKRRQFKDELEQYTHMWPWYEIGRVVLPKMKMPQLINHPNSPMQIDNMCQNLDRRVAARIRKKGRSLDAVYGYEDVAEFSFREAKANGLACLYDLPIGYWKAADALMKTERERCPEYFNTIINFGQTKEKLARKEAELSMADTIYAASSFTAKTLQYHTGALAPVKVIPYGFPPVFAGEKNRINFGKNRKLRLLFVGSLSQRKGIAEIFDAVARLSQHVELTVVGTKTVEDCTALNQALTKHTWIPSLSHDKILETMRSHDVLLFPSLFEGFGLVITEAMSQGTPVITTERTAGPDIIEHEESGWIIEAGNADALYLILEKLLLNPNLVEEAGRQAKVRAAARPWQQYGFELAQEVSKTRQSKSTVAQ